MSDGRTDAWRPETSQRWLDHLAVIRDTGDRLGPQSRTETRARRCDGSIRGPMFRLVAALAGREVVASAARRLLCRTGAGVGEEFL